MTDSAGKTSRFIKGAALVGAGALGATILTGVAYAATNTANSVASSAVAAVEGHRGPGGMGDMGGPGGKGGFGPGGMGGELLHSEATVETSDGTIEQVRSIRGEVTAVSADSITVRASDGFEQTFAVNAETEVDKSRNEATITDVVVGDIAMVKGIVSGDTATADHVAAMTATEAAEMEAEREQRRTEMMQEMEERLQEMQQEQGSTTTS